MIQLNDKQFEVFISADDIAREIKSLALKIDEFYQGKELLIVGVLNGSFLFVADLVRELATPCEISFVKMSSYHGLKSSGAVDELIGLYHDIEGKHVVVVEDIVDSGLTIDKIITILHAQKPATVKICTLLYKPDAFQGKHKPDYVGFVIPNAFVVGYGLDYNEKGRNLRDIYQIKELC